MANELLKLSEGMELDDERSVVGANSQVSQKRPVQQVVCGVLLLSPHLGILDLNMNMPSKLQVVQGGFWMCYVRKQHKFKWSLRSLP